jgi:hypothetical protein
MTSKLVWSLTAALGLTALVVCAAAQDSADPRPKDLVPNPGVAAGQRPAAVAPGHTSGGFAFDAGQPNSMLPIQLSAETDPLVRQLGEAKSDAERKNIKAKLIQVLEKQFDRRQRRHEAEIEALEAQVKKLKDLVRARSENRREIVSRRSEQILREAQGLGW